MYTWEGMKIISYEKAKELYNNNVEVFLIYDNDDSEGAADSLEDMEAHYNVDGTFGVEIDTLKAISKKLLNNIRESTKRLKVITEALFDGLNEEIEELESIKLDEELEEHCRKSIDYLIEEYEIKELTEQEMNDLLNSTNSYIGNDYEPNGYFYRYDEKSNKYVGIDNSDYNAWTEEFDTLKECIDWLVCTEGIED